MLLSVFTRHSGDCKYAADRTFRRCNCPKWIGGQVHREYFRKSAGTRQWNEAEEYRLQLEETLAKGLPPFGPAPPETQALVAPPPVEPPPRQPPSPEVLPPIPKKPRVPVAAAVGAYLTDARSRGLSADTLSKLETIFRKQFLVWCTIQGFTFIDEIDLDDLLRFRSTWKDAPLASQKKQNRVIGFFWASMRRGYIKENPILGLGKIKVVHVPTDYFPRDEFQRIIDATYVYGDPRGGYLDVEDTRARLRALTLLMRWSGLRIRDAVTRSQNQSRNNLPPAREKPAMGSSLGAIPSFADTQQRWEEPEPYGAASSGDSSTNPTQETQERNALKESSLVFVRSQVEGSSTGQLSRTQDSANSPLLEVTPGTRIEAKLETQISSAVQAPVVAVVEYTYAIGDRIVVPAGAHVYGQLQQADRSGLIAVKFEEIELLDGQREKIDAIGAGLDLGPIKGDVFGKNTGKNFLVRAASGLGSVLAEIAGNNSSAAFSEDDMLHERVAENIGTAGDSEVMNLNANSRIVVSVPADTKIYVVFTKREENPPAIRKVASAAP